MNQIRAIQELNRKEIEQGISPDASWHTDYRDTAYVYFGGIPYELTEGDVITIFSQYGEPVFLKLVRDRETGKSKGFGWLKYEDQRSTDLAVDNLGGAEIAGRMERRARPRQPQEARALEGEETQEQEQEREQIATGSIRASCQGRILVFLASPRMPIFPNCPTARTRQWSLSAISYYSLECMRLNNKQTLPEPGVPFIP
ncbi:U2 snRNP component IST3 [Magnaporthiopsis poae ATCC 64411]|uniref:U2 snRNP component IST3 n=1 Tax=Magnaporthiopsis poae (strain ATCC 64411 / 73-15) TaxID=644358 RepID=A0A0C4DQ36_MAGP6|nr:U2 snRNP component IST3 [Magnaporthiopsis poae ATCC 64411]